MPLVAFYPDSCYAWFDEARGIRVPLRPFAGEMGVAPGKPGAHSTIPPYATGGNIDTRHLSAGSTLFLPVEVDGALFSIGVLSPPIPIGLLSLKFAWAGRARCSR